MANLWPEALSSDTQLLQPLASEVWSDKPAAWQQQADSCWLPLAAYLMRQARSYQNKHQQAPVFAVHGGQGSGKSTLCQALAELFRSALNWKVAVISIDDLYLTKAERQQLAEDVHPLLATRGVPGTHDVETGKQLFRQLRQLAANKYLSYPAFDKILDDRLDQEQWHGITGPVDLILFEGWCVGCQPGTESELAAPINPLEKQEDPDGIWRHWVNQQLTDHYQSWFAEIDFLLMLKVPDIGCVEQWRGQQESDNIKTSQPQTGLPKAGMTAAEIKRFVQHYQRLTERALTDMPGYADLVLELNNHHQVSAIRYTDSQAMTVEESV